MTMKRSCPKPLCSAHRIYRPTDLQERARLVWLWVMGRSVHSIALLTGMSVTTVYRWIRRWQREGHVNSRPKSGRPRQTTRHACARLPSLHNLHLDSSTSSLNTPELLPNHHIHLNDYFNEWNAERPYLLSLN